MPDVSNHHGSSHSFVNSAKKNLFVVRNTRFSIDRIINTGIKVLEGRDPRRPYEIIQSVACGPRTLILWCWRQLPSEISKISTASVRNRRKQSGSESRRNYRAGTSSTLVWALVVEYMQLDPKLGISEISKRRLDL